MASMPLSWKPKPSMAWLFVFFPALIYYMATRLHSWGLFRSSSVGILVNSQYSVLGEDCSYLSQVLYTVVSDPQTGCATTWNGQIYQVLSETDQAAMAPASIVATAWKHDEELGRGYLLLSTSAKVGKIWQWETGGGPIPIGRTLHMNDSGCRSHNCTGDGELPLLGSGGLVVEPAWEVSEEPRLVVAEWGERRIVRLEPNGARTPLLLSGSDGQRLYRPYQLLFNPFGDLLVLDTMETEQVLWQLPLAPHIPPLSSLAESREAHAWTALPSTAATAQKLLQAQQIGGMALVPNSWTQLYVTMKLPNNAIVLVELTLPEEGDQIIDDETTTSQDQQTQSYSKILLDFSEHANQPGAVQVDEKGHIYLAVENGVLLVGPSNQLLGKVSLTTDQVASVGIVDITLGGDKYLYISTRSDLYRMRIRNGPVQVPTDLLAKQ